MSIIVSDMFTSAQALTLDDFRNMLNNQAPVGFSPFQQFVAGDYEYDKALYRISMNSTSGDRGIITKLQVDVDVPDMMDRGRVTITPAEASSGKWVPFTRPFHVPPVPVVTLMSASYPCVPKVVLGSVTRTGFIVVLERLDGSWTDGVFTWAAHSY